MNTCIVWGPHHRAAGSSSMWPVSSGTSAWLSSCQQGVLVSRPI